MSDDVEKLREEVRDLSERLTAVEARLRRMDEAGGSHAAPAVLQPSPTPSPSGALPPLLPIGFVALVGRALMALGGGFLLRAVTESGGVPPEAGVLAGLAYAASWLLAADRAARRGEATRATFHGLTALALGFPLVLEATLRFALVGAAGAGALLVAFGAASLGVAARRGLGAVAWGSAAFGSAACLVLLAGTRDLIPIASAALALAAAVEWLSRRDRLGGVRWLMAATADAAVAVLVTIAAREGGLPEGYAPLPAAIVAGLALALPVVYVGSASARTLLSTAPPRAFDLVQTTVALALGLGAAAHVLSFAGRAAWPLAAAAVVLGLTCYFVAFGIVDRRAGPPGVFHGAATLAGLLTVAGSWALLFPAPFAAVSTGLGLAGLALGGRLGRRTLTAHGTLFLVTAVSATSLPRVAYEGLAASPRADWARLDGWAPGVALFGLCAGYVVLLRRVDVERRRLDASRLVLAVLATTVVSAIVAEGLARALAGGSTGAADWAATAALRTMVLSALAFALGALWRRYALPELRILAYGVLGGIGLKLVLEDLPRGDALTLFLALAAFGGSLVVVPRLLAGSPRN